MKDVLIFHFKIIEMVRYVRCETRAKQFELFTVERITEQTDVYHHQEIESGINKT